MDSFGGTAHGLVVHADPRGCNLAGKADIFGLVNEFCSPRRERRMILVPGNNRTNAAYDITINRKSVECFKGLER
jgi:hypothetical protein